MISTHTPLAGRDADVVGLPGIHIISTHTPLAGRDQCPILMRTVILYFYSHAPRGARRGCSRASWYSHYFYSHAPRGARPMPDIDENGNPIFLLTRPSRGATMCFMTRPLVCRFLLTRPSRGATNLIVNHTDKSVISTHTPLAGRDACVSCFSPSGLFLLTRPSRGATTER